MLANGGPEPLVSTRGSGLSQSLQTTLALRRVSGGLVVHFDVLAPHVLLDYLGVLHHLLADAHLFLDNGALALLIGKALVLGLLLCSALGFLGNPLYPLLGVLCFLLSLLHEGVPGLTHHLVLLSGLWNSKPHGGSDSYAYGAHDQGIFLEHPREAAAGPLSLIPNLVAQPANPILGLAGALPRLVLGLAGDLPCPVLGLGGGLLHSVAGPLQGLASGGGARRRGLLVAGRVVVGGRIAVGAIPVVRLSRATPPGAHQQPAETYAGQRRR